MSLHCFNRGSAMLHKSSVGMLQRSLLTLNIQTLDALERNHLLPNTLVDQAQPINAAPTQHIDCANSSNVLEGPSIDQIWFIKTRIENSWRFICGLARQGSLQNPAFRNTLSLIPNHLVSQGCQWLYFFLLSFEIQITSVLFSFQVKFDDFLHTTYNRVLNKT